MSMNDIEERITTYRQKEIMVCVADGMLKNKKITEIAAECNIANAGVRNHWKRAVKAGIVKLHPPNNLTLQARLERDLKLRHARVITTGHLSEEARKESICSVAAEYFGDNLGENAVVGISGGRYILAMAQGLDIPETFSRVKIVSLAEVGIHETVTASANFIVGFIKMNNPQIQPYALSSLPLSTNISMNDKDGMEEFLKKQGNPKSIVAYQRLFEVTDVYTSLGILDEHSTFWLELNEEQKDNIRELVNKDGVIGDCMYQLINADGKFVDALSLRGQFFGLPLSHLQQMVRDRKFVTVLAGSEKRKVVAAALKGKLFNCLICDEETAGFLLNPEEKEQPPAEEELARYYNLPQL